MPHHAKADASQKNILIQKCRNYFNTRGARGLISLKRQLKVKDSANTGRLSQNDFLQAFDDLKITNIQSSELSMIFEIYDSQRSGTIDYAAFFRDLLTEMPPQRATLVREAFKHIDSNNNGSLEIDELKAKFNAKRHPEVLSNVKNHDAANFEFTSMFTSLHSMNHGFDESRTVEFDDFVEWNTIISMFIERDCEFRNFIIGVWDMDVLANVGSGPHPTTYIDADIAGKPSIAFPARNTHEQWKHDFHRSLFNDRQSIIAHPTPQEPQVVKSVNNRAAGIRQSDLLAMKGVDLNPPVATNSKTFKRFYSESDEQILARIGKKLAARGARGIIGLGRSFRIMDDNNSHTLCLAEFTKAMRDYRISDSDAEIRQIFKAFDSNGTGEISYDEFVRAAVGEMNERRRQICAQAFAKMDRSGDGLI